MTVRDELERVMDEVKADTSTSEWDGALHETSLTCFDFLRDHGPALLAMVADSERYRWLRDNLQHVSFEGLTCDTSDIGLDYAIDQARAGK